MPHTFQLLSATLLALTLLLCGVYAGLALMCQIGVLPTMRQLDLRSYATAWRVMDGYMDRAMPPYKLSLLALNLAAFICLIAQHRTALASLTFVSFLLSLAALVLTVRKQIPLNLKLRSLPADADDSVLLAIREQTVRNFGVRLVLALVSFATLCFGVISFPLR